MTDSSWNVLGLDPDQINAKIKDTVKLEYRFHLSYLPDTHQIEMHIQHQDTDADCVFLCSFGVPDFHTSEAEKAICFATKAICFKDRRERLLPAPVLPTKSPILSTECTFKISLRLLSIDGEDVVDEGKSAEIKVPIKRRDITLK